MPAGDGWRGDLRGLGPEFENLQERKSREGILRWCGALYGDLAAAGNRVRVHKTLRVTPAMAANVTDRLWSLEELVERTSQ